MKVRFWGTRGSIPTINSQTAIYGGNTPCLTVAQDDTLLILDAGSGIRHLSESGFHRDFSNIHILLTHLHMDHIQGLGFFGPFFQKDVVIHMWGPSGSSSLVKRLNKYLSPPLFPVRIRDFACDLRLHEAPMKAFEIGPFTVKATYICHPGPTFGYRVSNGSKSIAYIPDHEPALADRDFPANPEWTSGFELADGADLLIHDGQFSDDEYIACRGWGHSSMKQAIEFAEMTGTKELILFHHDPSHDDRVLEEIFSHCGAEQAGFPVSLAREGDEITL